MFETQVETYGKLVLTQLFTHIWYGDWDKYEQIVNQLPKNLVDQFSFHTFYAREETKIWHENYFSIPGKYFIPPYMSSYRGKSENEEVDTKQDLLCLIGVYEKMGFYYPIEREAFPDHIGSLTAFITATLKEEMAALEEGDGNLANQLTNVRKELYDHYLVPCLNAIWRQHQNKFSDPFFRAFIPYYIETMEEVVH
ncbi:MULTISPECIES: molecular chaperone TorD family protein [Clostridia]|uniref:molecular chaperone TorD family protein n=1 Tax=Clostridia TaxID=186801 RepID=UPI000EA3224E|nr:MULTISPECIES: molecular chaperone TorD family protein [Clostridia]NBJ68711.1 hypothetical protein [Roseburia sp. 1XD42-34]RKI80616.1 hypothetical protein D7V87_03535 [Clostridium sp. 1xD42-85]